MQGYNQGYMPPPTQQQMDSSINNPHIGNPPMSNPPMGNLPMHNPPMNNPMVNPMYNPIQGAAPMQMPAPYQQQVPPSSSVFSLSREGTDPNVTIPSPGRQTASHVIPQLPIRNYEVASHYMNRKTVYENVFNDLKDHNKAICYSNIWYNNAYLGTKYPKNVEDAVMKYAPPNFVPPKMPEFYGGQEGDKYSQGPNQNYEGNYQKRRDY